MAGTYTEILEIDAPDRAVAGSEVTATVYIKNKHSAGIYITALAMLGSGERFIDYLWAAVNSGYAVGFEGSFIMPQEDVTIYAFSYFEATDGKFYLDDSMEKRVAVEGARYGFSFGSPTAEYA